MLYRILSRSIGYFYRLSKPSISEFQSIEQLQYDQKQRQLSLIEQMNNRSLNENRTFTKDKLISQVLKTRQELSRDILKRHLNFSAIAPGTLKHYTLEQSFLDNKIDYPFLLEEVETALPQLNQIPMHFSYKRGVPIIPEYEWDKKVAYIFNLPQDLTSRDISEKLGLQTIKQIKIQYCRLGLPAFAKVYFNSDESVTNLVLNNKSYIELNNRVCFIKTHFDKEKLQLKNRRLVIQNIEEEESDLIFDLSQYGRVVHLDYPTFITRNPSLEQVKQKYQNSDTLIKINIHRKDGSIDCEYYPSLEETYKMNTLGITNDLEANIAEKKQRLEAMYKNRMRYAQQVDVIQGKQNQISIKNMGYCIVTYSCTEQAQNCYFNLRFSNKVRLFNNKETEEFEIDEQYRKRILRFVDAEYRRASELKQNSKNVYKKEIDEYFSELTLFERLVDMQTYAKAIKDNKSDLYEEEPEALMSYFKTRVNEIKRDLQQKMSSKSFDQLAQKQLFGRVLPKQDPTTPKIKIDVIDEHRPQVTELMESDRMKNINSQSIKNRQKFYGRLKNRETRRMGADLTAEEEFQVSQGEEGEEQQQPVEDEQYTGQRGFSTIKKRSVAFRQRSSLELANYILRYCEFVRNIIQEYQGIFAESRFNHSLSSSFLNPEGLTFSDGSNYICEEDLPKTLECMRSFEDSQKLFSEFWKDYELFKSKSIDIQEYRYNVRNKMIEGLRRYFDNGVVKEVYEVEDGEDIEKKVLYLNATVAGFGEQFRIHQDENGNKLIIKVSKIQNICPIDRITKIGQAKKKFDSEHSLSQRQQQLFNKYKYHIIETGEIPSEVRKQFNISEEKSLDELFEQLASEAGIYKKDIEMLLNLQNFSEQQIGEDVALQLQLEKVRVAERQSSPSDFAKDPSNIQVRDRQGFFKVSKFRQI